MRKLIYLYLIAFFFTFSSYAQEWKNILDHKSNFFEMRDAARDYFYPANGEKRSGWKQFERWNYHWGMRVTESGEFPEAGINYRQYKKHSKPRPNLRQSSFPQWVSEGPDNFANKTGLGRLNFIRYHPTDSNTFYVGAPTGGLWRTTDGGTNYHVLNDTIASIGCADLAIDPNDPSVLYLGTGDRVNVVYSTYSDGIMKSTDGGQSWFYTGLTWPVSAGIRIGRMLINPHNSNVLFVVSENGIHKTTDAGVSWTNVQSSGDFYDIHYHPNDTSILYASSTTSVYRSSNGGNSFAVVYTPGGTNRIELAVSPADDKKVYALGSSNSNSLRGIYHSVDTGKTFSLVHGSSPNLLGYSSSGAGGGGQGWYDLTIAVSKTDEDEVIVGGINSWKSTDGANNFTLMTHWTGSNAPFVHADCHYLDYHPITNTMYHANDGGISRSYDGGASWINITNTLVISQAYRIGIDQNNLGEFLYGTQDNGTNKRTIQNGFFLSLGGDGMECIVSHTDPFTVWASQQNGALHKSTNGGLNSGSYVDKMNGINESGAWVTPYIMDPWIQEVLYAGFNNIFKTTDGGDNWIKANNSSFPSGGGKVVALAQSKWWPDRIAASKGSVIRLSQDGGTNWTVITSGTPAKTVTSIAFDNKDLTGETIWATFASYDQENQLFKTTNLGNSWTSESEGLPEVPANSIALDVGSPSGGIYVGTDIGVFFRNDSTGVFVNYGNGLPNVQITELEIHESAEVLFAATLGRGIWSVDLVSKGISGLPSYGRDGNLELMISPNPVYEDFNISWKGNTGLGEIRIFDLKGSLIHTQEIEISSNKEDLSLNSRSIGMDKGIYFVQIGSGTNRISKKLIIH